MNSATKYSLVLALLGLLWIGACGTSRTHDDAFTEEGLLVTNATELQHTQVTPHLEASVAEENVLWCASFQLAWNEACALVGEDLRFAKDEPAMVEVLNKKTFTSQHLDQESYVAVAGFVKDNIFGEIDQQLIDQVPGPGHAPLYPSRNTLRPRPQDIVAYSYLFKNLEFEVPFERIEKPMTFGAEEVPCFGVGEKYKHQHGAMLEQLDILDYQGEDDFVIELKTKGEQDQLILAKVQPAKTLQETVSAVQARAANTEPVQAVVGDVLKVPKLNFDITRHYRELEGKRFVVKNPKIARDLVILSALQNIRFQLDEEGVRLRSESHISFGCGAAPPPPPTRHIMVFDKPFLMLLKRVDADVPYFVLWVQNPELLVKVMQ